MIDGERAHGYLRSRERQSLLSLQRAGASSRRALAWRAMLDFARTAPIDAAYLRHVVDRLASIGSSPLGFRATGTPEDRAVADFVAAEMRDMGLAEVAIEPVPVDGWRLLDARVAFAAAPSTGAPRWAARRRPAGGRRARAARRRRHRRAPAARPRSRWPAASRCWTGATAHSPIAEIGLELGLRGARRRDSQLPRRRAVLPVGARARLVRLALVRRRAAVRDDGQGGRRRAPRDPRAQARSRCG